MRPTEWLILAVLMASVPDKAATGQSLAAKTSVLSLPSGVQVTIVEAPFAPSRNRIQGCNKDGGPCLINGRPPFGVSIGLPAFYVKSIRVSYEGRSYSLDTTNMYNAWGDRPLNRGNVRYLGGRCDGPGYCTIRGIFSDGGGAFVAQWAIYEGVSMRTVITGADDIVDLFIKNIDPPEYD